MRLATILKAGRFKYEINVHIAETKFSRTQVMYMSSLNYIPEQQKRNGPKPIWLQSELWNISDHFHYATFFEPNIFHFTTKMYLK